MKIRTFFIFLLSLLSYFQVNAQNTTMIGDTLQLSIDGYKGGQIQWQFSTDSIKWTDIKGATIEKLNQVFTTSGFFRAKVINLKCEYYSNNTFIGIKSQIVENPLDDKYSDSQCQYQGIPTIVKTKDGTLWAAWYSGGSGEGPYNFVKLVNSFDDGLTWSKPILVVDPPYPIRAFDPCLWISPNNEIYLFWTEQNTISGKNASVNYSKLNYVESKLITTFPAKISDGVMINKPIVTSDSTWLLPIAVWGKASYVYSSKDGGKTFGMIGYSQVPNRTFDEHMLIELNDKSLWELVRTSYGIGQTFSYDQGKTWTTGEPSGLINANSRFHIRRLKSGNIILIHHMPPSNDMSRSYLTVSLSTDEGKTWPYNLLLDERMGVSYPDAMEDTDGNIYIIYDHNRFSDKEILYAKINENDIIRGKIAANSRLKQVVDKP